MFYKFTSMLAATAAMQNLNEVTDAEIPLEAHEIWDAYMEKEEDVYNWFELEDASIKSLNGGTIHFLNVTS